MPSPRWAILIGIDGYIDTDQGPLVTYPDLQGCVTDVYQMEQCLLEYCAPDGIHITKLISARPDDPRRVADGADTIDTTYENIIAAIEKVTTDAQPGDLVYIHYSGRGARVKSIFENHQWGDLDEALVPANIGDGGRYLRDLEIAYLLQEMNSRGLQVTAVFDCCHSGGLNRGRQVQHRVRGSLEHDLQTLPRDRSMFPDDLLQRARQARPRLPRTVELLPGTGWLSLNAMSSWLLVNPTSSLWNMMGSQKVMAF